MRHGSNLQFVPAIEVEEPSFPRPDAETETLSQGALSRSQAMSDLDIRKLRRLIQMRATRTRFFPNELFSDPAWNMLISLALAEIEQRRVSISDLSAAADVPVTTALRWINSMTEMGIFIRSQDPFDQRRFYVSLSQSASMSMRGFISTDQVD